MEIIKLSEILFNNNIKYLERISVSKSRLGNNKFCVTLGFNKDDMELTKNFWGENIDDINLKVNDFINSDIKL